MSSFMQKSLADAAQRVPHWLQAVQARGQSLCEGSALPTRRDEHWKYTSLAALRDDYVEAAAERRIDALPTALAPGFGGPRLVFLDGVYQAELSAQTLPEGMSLCRFADADERQMKLIAERLNSALDPAAHVFAALNTATLQDGVFVEIAPDAAIDAPLEILWLAAADERPTRFNQRLLLVAGCNSRSSVVEHFAALDGEGASFSNGVTELLLEAGAHLQHYRLQEEQGEAIHIGAVHARLERDSHVESFHLGLGSRLKRLDLVVEHAGPGAHADLNGVYLPRGDEHIDYHTTIEHAVPHCSSDEVFRGIIADRASAVFNGRIHIHPQAQKTRAELSNRNLLTSNEAEVNSKPELEIYADDVQCAHGTTVAQLDALSLHYLRTRGVSREEAEVMLSFGFINELIDALPLDSLRAYLRPVIATRFAGNAELTRHLL